MLALQDDDAGMAGEVIGDGHTGDAGADDGEIEILHGDHGGSAYITHIGGWVGIVTAAVACYASAAGVVNGMSPDRRVLPVGSPLWGATPVGSRRGSPMPRRREVAGGH